MGGDGKKRADVKSVSAGLPGVFAEPAWDW